MLDFIVSTFTEAAKIDILGVFLTISGFSLALFQLKKTKKASVAALKASTNTFDTVSKNILISDFSINVERVQEIQTHIKSDKFDSANLRLGDLMHSLIQTKLLLTGSEYDGSIADIGRMIIQLRVMKGDLDKKSLQGSKVYPLKMIFILSEIEVSLSELNSEVKYSIQGVLE